MNSTSIKLVFAGLVGAVLTATIASFRSNSVSRERPTIEAFSHHRNKMLADSSQRPEVLMFQNQDWETIAKRIKPEPSLKDRFQFVKTLQPLLDTKLILNDDAQKEQFRKLLIPQLEREVSSDKHDIRTQVLIRRTLIRMGVPKDLQQLETVESWIASPRRELSDTAFVILGRQRRLSELWLKKFSERLKAPTVIDFRETLATLRSVVDFDQRKRLIRDVETTFEAFDPSLRPTAAAFLADHMGDLGQPDALVERAIKEVGLQWDEVVVRLIRKSTGTQISKTQIEKRLAIFESQTLKKQALTLLGQRKAEKVGEL